MLCERCKQKQATVQLTQTINGQTSEMFLCGECAALYEKPLSYQQFLQGLLNVFGPMSGMKKVNAPPQAESSVRCPACGLTYEGFQKTGKLGCAVCYQAFRKEMDPILKNIQGSNIHEGKFPQKAGVELLNKRKVDKLKLALAKAVENEEFEDAARLRDEIKTLEVAE